MQVFTLLKCNVLLFQRAILREWLRLALIFYMHYNVNASSKILKGEFNMLELVKSLNGYLWNVILIVLLCGTGIYYTFRLKFIQVRRFTEGFKLVFGNFSLKGHKHENGAMTPFQSISTAIAAQVGTGNIAGAATAVMSGGPGAIFWMWMSAFFGMATVYAEATLAQNFKTTVNGEVTGGPVYYIKQAFKGNFGKFLAVFFAVSLILALGFMGNMVQSTLPAPLSFQFLKAAAFPFLRLQ